jgi:hypothetical protein
MGYFANGMTGDLYEQAYCEKCRHYQGMEGFCPVWEIHLLYNGTGGQVGEILETLIPTEGVNNLRCTMLVEATL